MDIPSQLPCTLVANPDIAGIGVRVAIYVQALLNVVCALIFSRDTWITVFEHSILTTASNNLFIMGCALLVCSFVQGATFGLTVYHTLIVLNLNWLIGLSALLYVFILAYNLVVDVTQASSDVNQASPSGKSMMILSVAHLSGMGALGVWLWTKITSFGDQPECTPFTMLTVFGKDVNVLDRKLRKTSRVIYWMIAIPGANLVLMFLAAAIVIGFIAIVYIVITRIPRFRNCSWQTFILFGGIAIIALLDVLFIVDTELMISRAAQRSFVMEGEGQWTFGQTLALVGLVNPLVETGKMMWKARNEKKKEPQSSRRNQVEWVQSEDSGVEPTIATRQPRRALSLNDTKSSQSGGEGRAAGRP